MNNERIEGNWEQFKGKVKEMWGKLTDDDIALYKGKQEQFFGKVKEKYGVAKDEAAKTVKDLEKNCNYCYKDDRAA